MRRKGELSLAAIDNRLGSKVAIQPQQKVTISNPPDSKFLFTKERMEVIRNGTFRLYVYGRVEYRDVFN